MKTWRCIVMDIEALKELVKPELAILIPVMWAIGYAIKNTQKIDDKYIPIILGVVSILLTTLGLLATVESDLVTLLFAAITQGIIIAAVAVYGNQLIKQMSK